MQGFIESDNVMKNLCAAIVLQAYKDWCDLCEGKNIWKANYAEIRQFLTSDYGVQICEEAGVDAEIMLNKLEAIKRNSTQRFKSKR